MSPLLNHTRWPGTAKPEGPKKTLACSYKQVITEGSEAVISDKRTLKYYFIFFYFSTFTQNRVLLTESQPGRAEDNLISPQIMDKTLEVAPLFRPSPMFSQLCLYPSDKSF